MASFSEVLAEFKRNSILEPENIAPLVDDQILMNGLVAWKSVRVRFKEAKDCLHLDVSSKWEWLWEQIDFDATAFAAVSGIRQQDVMNLLTRLKGLRLIFPDGSINDLAKQFLQSIIMAKLKKVTKPASRAASPVTPPPPAASGT